MMMIMMMIEIRVRFVPRINLTISTKNIHEGDKFSVTCDSKVRIRVRMMVIIMVMMMVIIMVMMMVIIIVIIMTSRHTRRMSPTSGSSMESSSRGRRMRR